MRKQILLVAIILLTGSAFLSGLFFSDEPIVFRSFESATETGDPVLNRVRLITGWRQDIWLMQQSHVGFSLGFEKWDRLAIIVDKSVRPHQAQFYQFAPGELKLPSRIESGTESAPFKARCFACHSNGPRAIRMNLASLDAKVGWMDRAKVALWNLKIKLYGRVESVPGYQTEGGVPFRSRLVFLNHSMQLKSCVSCHSEEGIRKPLKFEHVGTAHFLVKAGFMPPFPFRVSPEDMAFLEEATRNKDSLSRTDREDEFQN